MKIVCAKCEGSGTFNRLKQGVLGAAVTWPCKVCAGIGSVEIEVQEYFCDKEVILDIQMKALRAKAAGDAVVAIDPDELLAVCQEALDPLPTGVWHPSRESDALEEIVRETQGPGVVSRELIRFIAKQALPAERREPKP